MPSTKVSKGQKELALLHGSDDHDGYVGDCVMRTFATKHRPHMSGTSRSSECKRLAMFQRAGGGEEKLGDRQQSNKKIQPTMTMTMTRTMMRRATRTKRRKRKKKKERRQLTAKLHPGHLAKAGQEENLQQAL
mmetsp:Transcript_15206/g.32787  ORF Transcript_15206/g.32787 Transcript_15206/m.32787 type:complete len:133 (+) Transcript_15206:1941-2339(+)